MQINFLAILGATVLPMILGFIWYHPKVFGQTWMKAAGITPEMTQGVNMFKMLGITVILSFFIAFSMQSVVVHQFSVMGLLSQQPDFKTPGSESSMLLEKIESTPYWGTYRTFKHGAFHGTLTALFFIIPVFGINALFERKSFKYVAVNGGYWILSLALMGGVICAFT